MSLPHVTRRRATRAASILLPLAALGAVGSYTSTRGSAAAPLAELSERPPLTVGISFTTPVEAERVRRELRRYVFGSTSLPTGVPRVEPAIRDDEFASGLTNLARVDQLTITMPLGFTSVAYHAVPRRGNGRLLVYHHGHRGGLAAGKRTIAFFLSRGYAVLVYAMPFLGLNTSPDSVATPCGRIDPIPAGPRTYHDSLACIPHALRYFVEPVVVGLNYADRFRYRLAVMAGLSGGGWITTVSAAVDARIRRSYPVAGSEPHYISARRCPDDAPETLSRCFGDFEQRIPGLYRIANHLELYALGSWGRGRGQLAIHNVHDRCCFGGRRYREWRPIVQASLRDLGSGTYDAIGDTTHRDHLISPFALRAIEADLSRRSDR